MPAERILQLETSLTAATGEITRLTLANAELAKQLADSDMRNKRLRRSSKRDETSLRAELSVAQNRKF